MRIQPKSIPSLRRFLVRMHSDLFRISDFVSRWEDHQPLSTFEKVVLTLEDKRFFRHSGFDITATLREAFKKITLRKHGGASTIDMQFVRTVTGYRQRTFSRKIYEMLLAFFIQFRYSKITILRSYLDCAYFGTGITGARQGSQESFDKEIEELDDQEASELAAMLVYPRPRKPSLSWYQKVAKRGNYGLMRMRALEEEFDKLPR